jgi:hypothetical protein
VDRLPAGVERGDAGRGEDDALLLRRPQAQLADECRLPGAGAAGDEDDRLSRGDRAERLLERGVRLELLARGRRREAALLLRPRLRKGEPAPRLPLFDVRHRDAWRAAGERHRPLDARRILPEDPRDLLRERDPLAGARLLVARPVEDPVEPLDVLPPIPWNAPLAFQASDRVLDPVDEIVEGHDRSAESGSGGGFDRHR